ncbi:hypothetical protein IC617_16785 [Neiella sp. HB171785]|uniref:Tetratricopeptide repeat protein n=1 Tax=Neiella litorisoli TaxID=2771431 RepID=A0A8J6QS70_9GAMM|nr:hypothetical protein [Neiella litorisoli]MBD1391086.1 hypothetical protein [Neiella litorisoli]
MSVINQMLRDLEQRKQPEQTVEQPQFHAPEPSPWRQRVLIIIVLALLAAAGYWWFGVVSPAHQATSMKQTVPAEPVAPPAESRLLEALDAVEREAEHNAEPETVQKAQPSEQQAEATSELKAEPKQSETLAAAEPSAVVGANAQPAELSAQPEPTSKSTAVAIPAEPTVPAVATAPVVEPAAEPEPIASPAKIVKAPSKAQISHSPMSEQQVVQLQLNEARAFAANGRQGDAEATYRKLLKRDPKLVTARMELVALLTQQRQEGRALKVVDEGLRYLPTNAQLVTLKAQLLLSLGRADDAWKVLQVVNESQVQETGFFVIKAGLASQRNEFDVAYRNYSILAVREPNQGRWWLGKAISAEQTGHVMDAVEGYRRALTSTGLSAGSMRYAQHRLDLLGTQSHGEN